MKKLLILLFLTLSGVARASHIVGGEFEMVYKGNFGYQFHLIIYFDEVNGLQDNKIQDEYITARIFRYSDNQVMRDLLFHIEYDSLVKYTQNDCAIGELVTSRMFYMGRESINGPTTIVLSPDIYNDPQGYYIIWERCCRNYGITNIISQDPHGVINSPFAAGQTFYLHFPPVRKNGSPFINSSPRLFPPLSDYGCPGKSYYADFAGTDDDGDSLAYKLVTPLKTHNTASYPPLLPQPFPEITWQFGYGLNNIMHGNPDLKISSDGLLTVTPSTVGLFVFAVECDEFRDGVKIGEVRRDFQMLVVDACAESFPPIIVGKGPTDANFGTTGTLSVSYDNTVNVNDRCFEVRISDQDALTLDDHFKENIGIRAIPIGFKKKINNDVLPVVKTGIIFNDDSVIFQICFRNECPYTPSGFFEIGIIAFDDACSQPRSDTLRVSVYIEPPPNQYPQFNNPGGLNEITATIEEGDELQMWPVQVTDGDNDVITYRLEPVDFELEDVGMTFTNPFTGQQLGPLNKQLTWDPKCDVYDFTHKTNFELYFIVDDLDKCLLNHPDTTKFNLTIDLPGNSDPIIDNNLVAGTDTLEITRKIYGDPIQISVSGTDADVDDVILLRGYGIDFSASAYGATFPKDTGNGQVASQFTWPLRCDNVDLDVKDTFEFRFMVVDSTNKCRFYNADTLHLIVHVEPPDNSAPSLEINSDNSSQVVVENSLTAILGSPISLILTGTDVDNAPKDWLKLELIGQSGNVEPKGFSFLPVEGDHSLQTTLAWSPDCSIFKSGIYKNQYTFQFVLSDNRCYNEKGDTLTLNLTVRDVDGGDRNFDPPNVFTPNGDSKNDFFAMVKFQEDTGEFINILPKDNCAGEFIRIAIYDRWGKQVFESFDRNFRWYGKDMPVGVYFYYIAYTNRDYKGIVSLRL